jgi:hypothetical protein
MAASSTLEVVIPSNEPLVLVRRVNVVDYFKTFLSCRHNQRLDVKHIYGNHYRVNWWQQEDGMDIKCIQSKLYYVLHQFEGLRVEEV